MGHGFRRARERKKRLSRFRVLFIGCPRKCRKIKKWSHTHLALVHGYAIQAVFQGVYHDDCLIEAGLDAAEPEIPPVVRPHNLHLVVVAVLFLRGSCLNMQLCMCVCVYAHASVTCVNARVQHTHPTPDFAPPPGCTRAHTHTHPRPPHAEMRPRTHLAHTRTPTHTHTHTHTHIPTPTPIGEHPHPHSERNAHTFLKCLSSGLLGMRVATWKTISIASVA